MEECLILLGKAEADTRDSRRATYRWERYSYRAYMDGTVGGQSLHSVTQSRRIPSVLRVFLILIKLIYLGPWEDLLQELSPLHLFGLVFLRMCP